MPHRVERRRHRPHESFRHSWLRRRALELHETFPDAAVAAKLRTGVLPRQSPIRTAKVRTAIGEPTVADARQRLETPSGPLTLAGEATGSVGYRAARFIIKS